MNLTVNIAGLIVTFCVALSCVAMSGERGSAQAQQMGRIEGQANYRERMALPPGAVLEAVLEDVTQADTKATEIARTTKPAGPGSPIGFSIEYDRSRIVPGRTYVVRARIMIDGRLVFASDTSSRVLASNAGDRVDLLLRRVPGERSSNEPPGAMISALGLRLPASFKGDLACPDCEAVRYQIDLWPDQVFQLHREWVGANRSRDDLGRWRADPGRNVLILEGVGETGLRFEIGAPNRLRLANGKNEPTVPTRELVSGDTFSPRELALPLAGEMIYMADAARFTECRSGRSYPMIMDGDFPRLEAAYRRDARSPAAPLYISFEGSIVSRARVDSGGTEQAVVVNRFINSWPTERCERARGQAALENTYWRIERLGEEKMQTLGGRREPHLLLRSADGQKRFSATVGCNLMAGSYRVDQDTVAFTQAATTMMACPPPLGEREKSLADALATARRWRVMGNTLELFNGAGSSVALFEAMYF